MMPGWGQTGYWYPWMGSTPQDISILCEANRSRHFFADRRVLENHKVIGPNGHVLCSKRQA